jgi:hypothetical protein
MKHIDDINDLDINDLDARQEEDSSVDEDIIDLESDDDHEAAADENLNDEEDTQESSDDEEEEEPDAGKSHRNPKVEKIIAKHTARRKAAEEKLQQAETELKSLRDKLTESTLSGKVYTSLDEVAQVKADRRKELDKIEDAIDEGGFETPDGKTIDVATLRKWKRAIREELEDALPAAERRLVRQEEINREQVARIYPELLSSKSDLAREATRIFDRIPGLRSDPEAYLLVGDLLRGRSLRMKIASNKGKDRRPLPPESRTPSASRSVRTRKPSDDLLGEISSMLDLP